ncbi:MAG: single-stranded DNA-binding protein [Oscillospiraceae bacterium]|jgi:single-strand DNA-binding protein|nr:single-stranded DNA-binding protein [Oscillospiraceae bacterium]
MNQCQLMGRLTAEPALRYTPQQIAVASFSLAAPCGKQKDKDVVTDFFPIIAWRAKAEFASKYLRKGRSVAVTGEIQTRDYVGKDGVKRRVTEIIAEEIYFADGKADERQSGGLEYPGAPDDDNPFL